MTYEVQQWIIAIGAVIAAITPVARGLMKLAHICQKAAMKSASKADDEWAVRFVMITESLCGLLTKITSVLPRLTVGTGVKR